MNRWFITNNNRRYTSYNGGFASKAGVLGLHRNWRYSDWLKMAGINHQSLVAISLPPSYKGIQKITGWTIRDFKNQDPCPRRRCGEIATVRGSMWYLMCIYCIRVLGRHCISWDMFVNVGVVALVATAYLLVLVSAGVSFLVFAVALLASCFVIGCLCLMMMVVLVILLRSWLVVVHVVAVAHVRSERLQRVKHVYM